MEQRKMVETEDNLQVVVGDMDVHRLTIWVMDKRIEALVDTGASVNLLRRGLYDEPDNPTKKTIRLAKKGATAETSGPIHVGYTLDDMRLETSMLLADDLHEECILGRPWLAEQQAIVDFGQRTIYYGMERRKCAFWNHGRVQPEVGLEEARAKVLGDLPVDAPDECIDTLEEFMDIFTIEPRPASTRLTEHRIILKDDIPVKAPTYRYSEEKKKQINEACEDMLQRGIIRRSASDYLSPVLKKKIYWKYRRKRRRQSSDFITGRTWRPTFQEQKSIRRSLRRRLPLRKHKKQRKREGGQTKTTTTTNSKTTTEGQTGRTLRGKPCRKARQVKPPRGPRTAGFCIFAIIV